MQFSSLWVQFLRKSGLNFYVRKGAVAAERAPYKSTPRKNFRAHAGAKMLPVVMEPGVRDPRAWTGPVGMELGGMLYKDLASDDDEAFERTVRDIFQATVELL